MSARAAPSGRRSSSAGRRGRGGSGSRSGRPGGRRSAAPSGACAVRSCHRGCRPARQDRRGRQPRGRRSRRARSGSRARCPRCVPARLPSRHRSCCGPRWRRRSPWRAGPRGPACSA